MELEYLRELLVPVVEMLLPIIGTYLAYLATRFVNSRISADKRKEIKATVEEAVRWVEQVTIYDVEVEGRKKFELAKDRALSLLNEKGLDITPLQLEALIESVVLGFNQANKLETQKIEKVEIEEVQINDAA